MEQHSKMRISQLLAASCLGAVLFCSPVIGAAETESKQLAMTAPSKDDLLMFWDEKELYVQNAYHHP